MMRRVALGESDDGYVVPLPAAADPNGRSAQTDRGPERRLHRRDHGTRSQHFGSRRQRSSWLEDPSCVGEPLELVLGTAEEQAPVVGTAARFEEFFELESRVLYRRFCVITGNGHEAEEIMQDAFLAIWERWDRVAGLDDPTG
jgi:Sigma-70 region 2